MPAATPRQSALRCRSTRERLTTLPLLLAAPASRLATSEATTADLAAALREQSNAAAEVPTERPSAVAVLSELRQWVDPPQAAAGAADAKSRAQMLLRLERLEATADAAGRRFETLQAEYDTLRSAHGRLQQRYRARQHKSQ